jgi:phage terminase large subunit-like protein
MLNFDVPIDTSRFGLDSEGLLGTEQRDVLHKYWLNRREAVGDIGIECYAPFTKEHQAFLLSTAHETALFGGNSSAKTWTAAAKFTAVMIGEHPTLKVRTPCTGWVACEDFSLTKEGPLRALLILGAQHIEGYNAHEKTITYKNGSTAQLKSYESGWRKYQAAAINVVWLDEEPPEEIYKECRLRTMRTSGYIFISMTPLEGLTWVYDEIFEVETPTIELHQVSLFDNYTLKEEDIFRTIRGYTEQEREARVYGHPTQMAGLIYPAFKRGIHVIAPFPLGKDYVLFTGIDPHITTPTAVVYLACGKLGDMYVIGDRFLEGSVKDIADEMKLDFREIRHGWAVMDSSARTDIRIFDRDIYSAFCMEGINALLAPKGEGSIGKGISEIREYLKVSELTGTPVLRFFDTAKASIKSMQTLTREQYRDESKQGKKDKISEGKHHHHAAMRYIFQLNPAYFEPMVEPEYLPPMDDAVGY